MTTLLVGCGYWGQNWAKTLNQLNALAAICEPNPTIQTTLKEKYPNITLYSNLSQALTRSDIDSVVVATPVSTHLDMARQCLLARKSVLVEKPMTLTIEESENLVRLADEHGVLLAVGHLLMYHPALLTLQNLIKEGELGEILSVQCTRVNLGKIRNEENVWWSLAPHDISILSMLLMEPFEVVSATKSTPLGRPEIADTVFASFQTSSGKSASIHVSWLSPSKKHETVVIGTHKIAIFEDTQPLEKKLMLLDYDMERQGDQVQSIQKGQATYVPLEMPEELLALEAKSFIDAVQTGQSLQNDGHNGLQVVQALQQVQAILNRQNVPTLIRR